MSSTTTVSNHPSSAVLLDHVTGSLAFAHSCIVATHLLHCTKCQDTVRFCEKVGDLLLAGTRPVEPPPGLLEKCLVSIARHEASRRANPRMAKKARPRRAAGDIDLPLPLAGLTPSKLRRLTPGVRHSTLWKDDRSTLHYIRVKAGVALPAHRHRGLELTCVLSGAFRDNGGKLYAERDVSEESDRAEPRPEHNHLVVAEPPEDCVCIMATTGRLRFNGWVARLLQPVMPF